MMPFDFLKLLWENKPEELFILIWILRGKQSHWFRSLPKAAEFLKTHQNDVYVGVGLAKQDYGPDLRCLSSDIAAIPGLYADFDIKSAAHPKDLPASIEEALTLIPASLPPTIIVATGNGLQAWWLFKEPWIFESEDERKEAATLSSRFQTLLRYNSSLRGWAFDRLSDLARLLRIPGTVNGKDPNDPKQVTVHSFGNHRYNPSEIEEFLDDLSIPDPEAEQSAEKDWKERFADKGIAINLSARIPQEMLDHWCEVDPRFKNTWFRQRHDLKDQSQSGYDMALACFGVAQYLDEQQIVDLIIHHHFLHRKKSRTRLDYFQRAISKAAKGRCNAAPSPPIHSAGDARPDSHAQAEQASPNGIADSADPGIAKAQIWERISEILGIRIYRVVKITGKDPIYRADLEGAKVEFSNVKKLVTQETFRCIMAAETDYFPPKQKPRAWEEIVRLMLSALTQEEGGEEMELEGRARLYISQYLAETRFIDSVEGQNTQNGRKPMILDGTITVCASDIQLYVNKTWGQSFSLQAIAGMLSVTGARMLRHRVKYVDQSRWRLPLTAFDPKHYSAHYREDMDHGD
jgi:hypothetical protein